VELLAGLDFGGVGQERILDLRHGSIVAGGSAASALRSAVWSIRITGPRAADLDYGFGLIDACSKALAMFAWRFVISLGRFKLPEVCIFV